MLIIFGIATWCFEKKFKHVTLGSYAKYYFWQPAEAK